MNAFINTSRSLLGNEIFTVLFTDGEGKHVSQNFINEDNAKAHLEHLVKNYSDRAYYR